MAQIPLKYREISVGRSERNDLRLVEQNISRKHAVLKIENGILQIEDLSSSNGISVNGKKVFKQKSLQSGDIISIGDFQIEIIADQLISKRIDNSLGSSQPSQSDNIQFFEPEDMSSEEITLVPEQSSRKNNQEISAEEKTDAVSINLLPQIKDPGLLLSVSQLDFSRRWVLDKKETTIGRSEDCDIIIRHSSVSRYHCMIRYQDGQYLLFDTYSSNGLWINDEKSSLIELENNDFIEIGDIKLQFFSDVSMVVVPMTPETVPGSSDQIQADNNTDSTPLVMGSDVTQVKTKPSKKGKSSPIVIISFLIILCAAIFYLNFDRKFVVISGNDDSLFSMSEELIDSKLKSLLLAGNFNDAKALLEENEGRKLQINKADLLELEKHYVAYKASLKKLQNGKIQKAYIEITSIPKSSLYYSSGRIAFYNYFEQIEDDFLKSIERDFNNSKFDRARKNIEHLTWYGNLSPRVMLWQEKIGKADSLENLHSKEASVDQNKELAKIIKQVVLMIEEKRFLAAIEMLDENMKNYPDNVDLLFQRANALLETGNYRKAKLDYEKVLNLDPKYPRRAKIKAKLKQIEKSSAR